MVRVGSTFANGTRLGGITVVLQEDGNTVSRGLTPAAFTIERGRAYTVTAEDYRGAYFNHWSNSFTIRTIPLIENGSTSLDAIYTATPEPPPPTKYSIAVTSHDLNGTTVDGFAVDLRVNGYHIQSGYTPVKFGNLEPGLQFQVVIYFYGNYYFRHFSDGDLNRYKMVTLTSSGPSVALDAMYQYVPPSKAATLDVKAEFANGTVIGSTFNNTNYIQHTPGMWLTVTPPGSDTPFTGTFTGGSILPFVLLRNESYVVTMTQAYGSVRFSHWQDTGGTNPVRELDLSKNTTVVAIYVQG